MNRMFHALRTWFRGKTATRRPSPPKRTSLTVEILEDRVVPATTDWRSVIGLDAVRAAYPYQGAGYSVAILDTGIDYNHADLGGGFGAGKRVVAGWDFVNNDANPMDDHGHGTHLAGIIGSSNATTPGVDPGANLIALKVLDATNTGTWANIDAGLQWVIANKTKYNIVAVNISLGSGNFTVNPYSFLESDFATLKSLGVFTAAAAGNKFYTFGSQPGIGYPSISSNVVSVGATWAGDFGSATFSTGAADYATATDRVVSMGQRGPGLSIMAPGAWITSTGLGNTSKAMGGTSMATAIVTGAAALIHEAYDRAGKSSLATQDNILSVMRTTGVTVVDGDDENDNVANTGLSFKRLNLKAALDTIGRPNTAPTLDAIPNQTLVSLQTITVPLVASDPDGDPLTFTYRLVYLPALAFQTDQALGFTSDGNYYTNSNGVNEKWIYSSVNKSWYWLMPNGELRRYTGTTADTLQAANLVATYDASYYADPRKVWNAPYAGNPPIVFTLSGKNLSIRSSAPWLGTFAVEVTASDGRYSAKRSFNVTEVAAANTAPSLAVIANQTMSHTQDKLTLTLSATDAQNDPLTYSAQVLAINGVTPAVTTSVLGTQLTLDPASSFVGTFTVQANVSDGKAVASRTFIVNVTNNAPTLGAIGPQTMAKGQTSLTIVLPASDTDNDKLTVQAVAQTPDALAYQLKTRYGLAQYGNSYFTNVWGYNEKWLIGANNQWYVLLPTGAMHRWTQSITETLKPTNYIATLDPSFYVEPRLLWNAQPPVTPALTFTIVGNQLTIQRPASLTGIFFVDVTVSDGWMTVKRTVQVTLN